MFSESACIFFKNFGMSWITLIFIHLPFTALLNSTAEVRGSSTNAHVQKHSPRGIAPLILTTQLYPDRGSSYDSGFKRAAGNLISALSNKEHKELLGIYFFFPLGWFKLDKTAHGVDFTLYNQKVGFATYQTDFLDQSRAGDRGRVFLCFRKRGVDETI